MRGDIYEATFIPQFSGHETFPLRYSWLKKVFDALHKRADDGLNRRVFVDDDAISKFGVGKNMVGSMRYWSIASRMLVDTSNSHKGPYKTTPLANAIFDDDTGWDPYIENPATLWLVHWQLASNPLPATTIYFAFNHFHTASFYRQQLTDEIQRYCDTRGDGFKIAAATLKRDVDCFLRTYAARVSSEEDSLDSLLAELSLIRPIGKADGFILARGSKSTLPDGVFIYGLLAFALARGASRVLSVESLLHDPGSPGRVFLLDEDALLERLGQIDQLSRGKIAWSETAGLRQIIFHEDPAKIDALKYVASAYRGRSLASLALAG